VSNVFFFPTECVGSFIFFPTTGFFFHLPVCFCSDRNSLHSNAMPLALGRMLIRIFSEFFGKLDLGHITAFYAASVV
jgi:hypothetical protein